MITTKKPVTYEQLQKLPPYVPPKAKGYHKRIAHHQLVALLNHNAQTRGWLATDLTCHLTRKDKLMAASVVMFTDKMIDDDLEPTIGLTNSVDGRLATNFYSGVFSVKRMVGVPLMKEFIGKHTKGLSVRRRMGQAVYRFYKKFDHIKEKVEWLKGKRLGYKTANTLMTMAARKGWIPWGKLQRVSRLYFLGGNTAWQLILAFCEVMKGTNPIWQMERCYRFATYVSGDESILKVGKARGRAGNGLKKRKMAQQKGVEHDQHSTTSERDCSRPAEQTAEQTAQQTAHSSGLRAGEETDPAGVGEVCQQVRHQVRHQSG